MKAHQRIIREQQAEIEAKENLFGAWWENVNLNLRETECKPISYYTTKKVIEKYEWLGCMPAIVWFTYGIFFEGNLGGCVVFGPEYSENLGVWDKYDYTGKIILLSRGVSLHWTPINTASHLISLAIKMLPEKFKIITATVDRLAGEIGTIYQACNFDYVGQMRLSNTRDGWLINGKLYGSRSIRSKLGCQRKEEILEKYPQAQYVEQISKERYFCFVGSVKDKKFNKGKIKHLIKPYPKRAECQESTTINQNGSAGQFRDSAPIK